MTYETTPKQEQAIREWLQEAIVPLIEQVLVKKLGQAMSFAAEQAIEPKRNPLTDAQINLFINGRGEEGDDDYVEPTGDGFGLTDADLVQLVRRVEAAHGIKGNA